MCHLVLGSRSGQNEEGRRWAGQWQGRRTHSRVGCGKEAAVERGSRVTRWDDAWAHACTCLEGDSALAGGCTSAEEGEAGGRLDVPLRLHTAFHAGLVRYQEAELEGSCMASRMWAIDEPREEVEV